MYKDIQTEIEEVISQGKSIKHIKKYFNKTGEDLLA